MSTRANRQTGYGWPVLTSTTRGPLPRLREWVIPGARRRVFLRDGSAGFLFIHFALWWHERIHPLDVGVWDEWGWADRPVRGSNLTSEHAGGVAIDLDATLHPRGVPILRTFKPWQRYRINRKLKQYKGCIGWGGHYKNTPDGMHFEIAEGKRLADVERVARELMHTHRGRRVLAANPGARQVIVS